jgi:hypothetical protein
MCRSAFPRTPNGIPVRNVPCAGPIVVSVPAFAEPRYYSVQLCDSNAFVFGYIGTRTTGCEAADFLIAGPDWKGEATAGNSSAMHSALDYC